MIEEIRIDIEDTIIFANAAYILDQDKLLNKMHEIRQYWELRKNLIPYSEFDIWYETHKNDFSLTPEVANHWGELPDFSFTQTTTPPPIEIIQKIATSDYMELELEHLLRKNGLTASFRKFILKAIVCGEVKVGDWESTKEDEKFLNEDSFFNIVKFEKLYKDDTKTEIKRDREWYWESKRGGKTPMQIAKETKYRPEWIEPGDFRKNIDNAIKRYKLFLNSQGTFRTQK